MTKTQRGCDKRGIAGKHEQTRPQTRHGTDFCYDAPGRHRGQDDGTHAGACAFNGTVVRGRQLVSIARYHAKEAPPYPSLVPL